MSEQSELLELFRNYNPDIWPLPIVAYIIGIGVLGLIVFRPSRTVDRLGAGVLALLWLWLGVVFQAIYVRDVNPVLGVAYAAIFIVEATLIARSGIVQERIAFRPAVNAATIIGALAILYALVVYPLVGIALGHGYPEAALFGAAPCPTTIVTFGLFLFVRPPFPKHLLAIPLVWAVLAPMAAVPQGVVEDSVLFLIGIAAAAMVLIRDGFGRSLHHAAPAAISSPR
jgi:hypothetical protein